MNPEAVQAFCWSCGRVVTFTPDPERDGDLSCERCGAELFVIDGGDDDEEATQ